MWHASTRLGSLLAQATLAADSWTVPCWEQANFASPVSIAANTTYAASYYTSNGRYLERRVTNH